MIRTMSSLVLLLAGAALAAGALPERRTPVVMAVEKALPSVVNIGTERFVKNRYTDRRRQLRSDLFDEVFRDFFGPPTPPGYQRQPSLGSGVIIHPDGYILTNYHVVERASIIQVTTHQGHAYTARLLAGDELNDLALLKVEPREPLEPIALADDNDLYLGETVIAIGNPLRLSHTVTVGVLSAKNREASYNGEVLFRDILQTDADINLGSSGGPLLNVHGELIGVNVALYADESNIGFAIPVSRARALLADWFSPKITKKLWLGFDLMAEDGQLVVREVAPGSIAEEEGLRPGDQVTAINGEAVSEPFEFYRVLLPYVEGDGVELEVQRGEENLSMLVPLMNLPQRSGAELARDRLGLSLNTERPGTRVGTMNFMTGVEIMDILEGQAAAAAGLRPGLLLTRINDYEIDSLDDVGVALQDVRKGDPVTLILVSIHASGPYMVAQRSSLQLQAN